MADFFDDVDRQQDKTQKIKSNEITGDRYFFHSLPKEFQDMGNVYYVQEKAAQGTIDKNAISKANFNGYMWLAIGDGTAYGIYVTIAAIFAVIKWKLSEGFLGFVISGIIYIPILFFIGYHLIYYAIIRSQIIGPITQAIANFTSYTFYITFVGVFLSLMVVFVFLISFMEDLVLLLFELTAQMSATVLEGTWQAKFLNVLIWLHNKLVEIFINSNNGLFGNIYVITAVTVVGSLLFLYWFEYSHYKPNHDDIQEQYALTGLSQGYPIELAQRITKKWRAEKEAEMIKRHSASDSLVTTDIAYQVKEGSAPLSVNNVIEVKKS